MFTVDQLIAHAIGDYIFQTDWMADNKTRSSWAALVHVIAYLVPFLFITQSVLALLVMGGTHFLIDRFRLARYLNWVKNIPWTKKENSVGKSEIHITKTGFSDDKPEWMSVWLLIITDNIMHVVINGLALYYLR